MGFELDTYPVLCVEKGKPTHVPFLSEIPDPKMEEPYRYLSVFKLLGMLHDEHKVQTKGEYM